MFLDGHDVLGARKRSQKSPSLLEYPQIERRFPIHVVLFTSSDALVPSRFLLAMASNLIVMASNHASTFLPYGGLVRGSNKSQTLHGTATYADQLGWCQGGLFGA